MTALQIIKILKNRRGELATVVALIGLGIVTLGIIAGKQLTQTGPRNLPQAATTDCVPSILSPANNSVVRNGTVISWAAPASQCIGVVMYGLRITDNATGNKIFYPTNSKSLSFTIPTALPLVQVGKSYNVEVKACFVNDCSNVGSLSSPRTYWWVSQSTPACGPSNCPGCCYSNTCQLGNTLTRCGTGGASCESCASGQSCVSGACYSAPTPTPTRTPTPAGSSVRPDCYQLIYRTCEGTLWPIGKTGSGDIGGSICSSGSWTVVNSNGPPACSGDRATVDVICGNLNSCPNYYSTSPSPSCTSSLQNPANGAVLTSYPTLSWSACSGKLYQVNINQVHSGGGGNNANYGPISGNSFNTTNFSWEAGDSLTWRVRTCDTGSFTSCLNPGSWSSTRTFWWKFNSSITPTRTPTPTKTPTPTGIIVVTLPPPLCIYCNSDAQCPTGYYCTSGKYCRASCLKQIPKCYIPEPVCPPITPTPTRTPTPLPTGGVCVAPVLSVTNQACNSNNQASVTWKFTKVDSANEYRFQRDNNANFSSPEKDIKLNATTNTFTDSFQGDQWWRGRVRVRSAVQCTAPSVWSNVIAVGPCGIPTLTSTPNPTVQPSATGGATQPTDEPPAGGDKIYPLADTYVNADSKNSNYCSKELQVDGSPVKITFMRFDLSTLTGATINSAKLWIRITDSSSSTQKVKAVSNNSWDECSLNYDNKPSLGSQIGSNDGGTSGTWKSIDITSHVNSKKGEVMSIAIDSSGSNGLDFYSRENSTNKPYIEINGGGTSPTNTPQPPGNCPAGDKGNLDCNIDGCINTADYELFRQVFGSDIASITVPAGQHTPDLVVDSANMIDTADYEILRSNFGSCLP